MRLSNKGIDCAHFGGGKRKSLANLVVLANEERRRRTSSIELDSDLNLQEDDAMHSRQH